MTRDERDKICKTCKNYMTDDRYGILCGLTKNISNFQDNCKSYHKIIVTPPVLHQTTRTIHKRKDKKGFKSFLGAGISLWLIFKLIMLLIKFLKE